MRTVFSPLFPCIIVLAVVTSACQKPAPPAPAAPPQPPYTPVATIKDLMLGLVDTSGDAVWDAVKTTSTRGGVVETAPKSEAEWAEVRYGALRLMEATNLLMIPGRHVAAPGERSDVPCVEEEPADIEAAIAKDPTVFQSYAKGLYNAVNDAMEAINAKDSQKLFLLGDKIDTACENCHMYYWYPRQRLPGDPTPVAPCTPKP